MGMSAHQRPHHGATDSWLTPPEIWLPLVEVAGKFDLDPCAASEKPDWIPAWIRLTVEHDGLSMPWRGYVWCNPPFGAQAAQWLARMAEHGNGVALCAARTETRWFVAHVWESANAVLFLHGRPHFHTPDGRRGKANSGAPICLVAYGSRAVRALAAADLEGTLVLLAPVAELMADTP